MRRQDLNEVQAKVLEEVMNLSSFSSLGTAIEMLKQGGVFTFMKELARPRHAQDAERAIGYAEALDDLMYFRERFLVNLPEQVRPPMDFGGFQAAIQAGHLTEEEANAIRLNTPDADIIRKYHKLSQQSDRI